MFEAITAWSTIAIAVATFGGVYVAYKALKSQGESLANSVSADLALKLVKEFDDEEHRKLRSCAADAFLKHLKQSEIDNLFDTFEMIGLLSERDC